MATYNSIISRTEGTDPLVPEPVSAQIIQQAPTQSALLQRARSVTLSAKTQRMPVLDVMPVSYWVGGDTGLKQTTDQEWKGVNLIVEELATIVPIPEAYLDDAQVPIWSEVQPRMTESAGKLIDQAALFGLNKPATWPTSIYDGAVAAGNTVADGTGADFGVDVASLGELMATTGYSVNGFASRPGLNWRLVGMRTAQGAPIYQPSLQQGVGGGVLYGYPLAEVNNGSWDATEAQLIAGDWTKAIVGIRQDITFKMFTEGVISDDSGAIILNLMQQDAVAMRMVMRVAYAVASPVTALDNSSTRFPFGVITSGS